MRGNFQAIPNGGHFAFAAVAAAACFLLLVTALSQKGFQVSAAFGGALKGFFRCAQRSLVRQLAAQSAAAFPELPGPGFQCLQLTPPTQPGLQKRRHLVDVFKIGAERTGFF